MADAVHAHIDETVKNNKVLIYMKGNRTFPMCGFSAATIQIFDSLGVPYETVDVLQDPAVVSLSPSFGPPSKARSKTCARVGKRNALQDCSAPACAIRRTIQTGRLFRRSM